MIMLNNQKGVVLITTFMVVLVLVALVGAFTARSIHEKTLVQRQDDSIKAFYNAEKGIAYAYFEGDTLGWTWFTHDWNTDTNQLESNSLISADAERTQGTYADCSFLTSGLDTGCYAADDGSFIVKTFPDPSLGSAVTVIRSKGISGTVERVLEYRISRRSIYNYYMWTPYDLTLGGYGEFDYNCGGGGIHTNGDLTFNDLYHSGGARLNAISELSTGLNKTIQYDDDKYGRPCALDWSDGVEGDFIAPLPDLNSPHIWTAEDPYPYSGSWHTSGSWPTAGSEIWPPRDWRSVDYHFSGHPDQWHMENTRLSIVKRDSNGNVVFGDSGPVILATVEIPGHLSTPWIWDKYVYDGPGYQGYVEGPTQFIDGNGVIQGAGSQYWTDLAAAYPGEIDPAILDGEYYTEGETDMATNFNTMQQDAAWDAYAINPSRNTGWNPSDSDWAEFINNQALKSVVYTNDDGFNLSEPKFAETYKKLAEKDGLLFDLTEHTSCTDWELDNSNAAAREQCLQVSIDSWVTQINDAAGTDVAISVSFVNTLTNRMTDMIEIDVGKMETAGNYPSNGIIYSQIPIRLTNAQKLPDNKGDPAKNSFSVISEENVYLKGDYNNPALTSEWMPSAIVTKKKIYTLSDKFNDPQVTPALIDYLYHDDMFVAYSDTLGRYGEVDHAEGSPYADTGMWLDSDYLDDDGVPDGTNKYPSIPEEDQYQILLRYQQKDADYYNLFDADQNPSPTATHTFNWTRLGDSTTESYTWGEMPPEVDRDYTYNCLMAAYRVIDNEYPRGHLERWSPYDRKMNGAYFKLMKAEDAGDFAAPYGDYVDEEGDWARDRRGRPGNLWHDDRHYVGSWYATLSYDSNFVSSGSGTNKGIFFGGGPPPTWREISISEF